MFSYKKLSEKETKIIYWLAKKLINKYNPKRLNSDDYVDLIGLIQKPYWEYKILSFLHERIQKNNVLKKACIAYLNEKQQCRWLSDGTKGSRQQANSSDMKEVDWVTFCEGVQKVFVYLRRGPVN